MSELIIIAFPDEATAFAAGKALVGLQKEILVEMQDVVVVTRGADGRVGLHQAVNLATGAAIGGGIWGVLMGLLFVDPAAGPRAKPGAFASKITDSGIDAAFLRKTGQSLNKGGAAVGIMVRNIAADTVLERLKAVHIKGKVMKTTLTLLDEAKLKQFLLKIPSVGQLADQPNAVPM